MSDWHNDLYWNLAAYAAVAGAGALVLVVLFLAVPALRERWLPMPRLRRGSWTGHEVFLTFCAMIGFPILVAAILYLMGFFNPLLGPAPEEDAPDQAYGLYHLRCGIISTPLGVTVTLGIIFAILFARTRSRPHHLGLTWTRWQANVGLGLAAFVLTTPLVLGVHFLAYLAMGDHPHALTRLGQAGLHDWEWFFIAFAAVVAAPLLEEVVFRGVLQGWLRRASLAGHLGILSATIVFAVAHSWFRDPVTQNLVFEPGALLFAFALVGGYVYGMVRLSRRFELDEMSIQEWLPQPTPEPLDSEKEAARMRNDERRAAWRDANAKLAIYGSAMLFASVHAENWPAPIAIFLLGLVLGVLAWRTQSLVGPITLHATFNLVAFIALYGTTHYDVGKNGKDETTAPASPAGVSASSIPASQLPLRK